MKGRGFEKFLMEGAYSRCQSFATEVYYFNIFEINFDSGNEKIAKENQVVREVWILPLFQIVLKLLTMQTNWYIIVFSFE